MYASIFTLLLTSTSNKLCDSLCIAKINMGPIQEKYLSLLRNALTGSLYDEVEHCRAKSWQYSGKYDAAKRQKGNDWPVIGHTMVGHDRLINIQDALFYVVSSEISGHFAELGVWRGGASIYARLTLNTLNEFHRKTYVLDAFEKLPSSIGGYGSNSNFLRVSEEEVRHNFEKYNATYSTEIQKGLFQDTTPVLAKSLKQKREKLAVLRVDGNFYSSYESVMYELYPLVSVGGVIIFDDVMSHASVMKFWNDFKKDYKLDIKLNRIDVHSAWFIKDGDIVLNESLRRNGVSENYPKNYTQK